MREMKYMAWDEKKKEMIGPWDMHFFSINADWIGHPNLCFGERVIGNPTEENIIHNIEEAKDFSKRFKVRQFTGLKDKKGIEIYEGDIVELKAAFGTENYISEWSEDNLGFSFKSIIPSEHNMFISKEESLLHAEVIGNIWENGDLLDEK